MSGGTVSVGSAESVDIVSHDAVVLTDTVSDGAVILAESVPVSSVVLADSIYGDAAQEAAVKITAAVRPARPIFLVTFRFLILPPVLADVGSRTFANRIFAKRVFS